MMRLARRDPIWAVSSIIMSPFRAGRYLLQVGLFILIVGAFTMAAEVRRDYVIPQLDQSRNCWTEVLLRASDAMHQQKR